jgi:hypothetical protein
LFVSFEPGELPVTSTVCALHVPESSPTCPGGPFVRIRDHVMSVVYVKPLGNTTLYELPATVTL